jgi:hypothetical protein
MADTVQKDKFEQLLDGLNTISGLIFVEDAWLEKAPENYGVVELEGEIASDSADGKKIAQGWQIRITVYVNGNSHKWITDVQDVLARAGLPYTAPQREYLHDINKVRWSWVVRMKMGGSLTIEGTAQHASGRSF